MSIYQHGATRQKAAGQPEARRSAATGEVDGGMTSLRDTLDAISVREANFSEFLAALKHYGLHRGK